ncbi:MAG TPA: hypothetical protein VH677_01040 [Nitrososphaera sp.]|jgi:hypothetical protein
MLTPELSVNVAFVQSFFGGNMLNQVMMDDMSLMAVAIVLGLVMIVIIALMSMVGGLHVFD